jgi:hypothetical protein
MRKVILATLIALFISACDTNTQADTKNPYGDWQLTDSNDAGNKFYRVTLQANQDSQPELPIPQIEVGCQEILLQSNDYIPERTFSLIRFNNDDGTNKSNVYVSFSTDNIKWIDSFEWEYLLWGSASSAIIKEKYARKFSKLLLSREKLHMKILIENEPPREISFDLTGYNNAVKDIRELCEW